MELLYLYCCFSGSKYDIRSYKKSTCLCASLFSKLYCGLDVFWAITVRPTDWTQALLKRLECLMINQVRKINFAEPRRFSKPITL